MRLPFFAALCVACVLGGCSRVVPRVASVATCEPVIAGADLLLSHAKVVILGEVHGTQEIPRFVGSLVCEASKSGPVTLALEWPPGLREHAADLLNNADLTWQREQPNRSGRPWLPGPDGRDSHAMHEMLDGLRALRKSGRKVDVFLFDNGYGMGDSRDVGMARQILFLLYRAQQEKRQVVVLTGNAHAMKNTDESMAWHIVQSQDRTGMRVITLNVAFSDGTAWGCRPGEACGVIRVTGRSMGSGAFVRLEEVQRELGFDGVFYVAAVSASPPFVRNAAGQTSGAVSGGSR